MTSIIKRGNETRVNTTTILDQTSPQIATLANGDYVITWVSFNQDGSFNGIYMQMYSFTGLKYGPETLVTTTTLDNQSRPAIAALEGGGFVIGWDSNNQDGSSEGVYFQRFDEFGTPLGIETRINTATSQSQYDLALSAMQGGGFVATWSSYGQDAANSYGIYGRVFNEGGGALTAEFAVNTTTLWYQSDSSVATLSDGSFVVTWNSDVQDGENWGVYTRRFNVAGVAQTPEIHVSTSTSYNQYLSSVMALSNGGYVIVWQGNGEQTANTDTSGIFFQIFNEYNSKYGWETLVNSYTNSHQLWPSLTALSDGGFVITWSSALQDGSSSGVFGQRYDETGTKIGPEFQINSSTLDDQSNSSVSALPEGGFVVTWHSMAQDGVGYGIYSRRYESATTLSGTQYLYGTLYNDVLDGGIGNDYMYGGQGDDTYLVNSSGDVIGEKTYGGIDTVESSISYSLLGSEVENLSLMGANALFGYGNSLNNLITGNSGNNNLFGFEGEDTIYAGAGNDYISGGEHNDILFGESGQDQLFGGPGSDTVYGGEHNDIILASEGIDYLYGEAGIDTLDTSSFYYAGVYVNLATGRSVYNGVISFLSGFENIIGTDHTDKLAGDGGNNVLNGGAGADTLIGGLGDDVYYLDNTGDVAVEVDGQGDDLLFSSVNVDLGKRSVETVILTGTANLTFVSKEQATEIWGNSGNNTINPGRGIDTMIGGAGDDNYYVEDVGDLVTENASEGNDRVAASIDYTLTAHVEKLQLFGTGNISGTGNDLDNIITGSSTNNRLDGGVGGSDSLRGMLGDDTYVFNLGFGIDEITNETGGADTILFGPGITSGMIITQDVGADRYYAISDGINPASTCANRVRIVGGAAGIIETIAYTPPAAPMAMSLASSMVLKQSIAALPAGTGVLTDLIMPNMKPTRLELSSNNLVKV